MGVVLLSRQGRPALRELCGKTTEAEDKEHLKLLLTTDENYYPQIQELHHNGHLVH